MVKGGGLFQVKFLSSVLEEYQQVRMLMTKSRLEHL